MLLKELGDDKKYQIIYADPSHVKNGYHYAQLLRENLVKVADEDCLLFLWSSGNNLDATVLLGELWGFKYTTIAFIWDCMHEYTHPSIFRESCYYNLVFKRGRIPKPRGARNVRQWLQSSGKSGKPMDVLNRITTMFPEQNKIELFSNYTNSELGAGMFEKIFDGWDSWKQMSPFDEDYIE